MINLIYFSKDPDELLAIEEQAEYAGLADTTLVNVTACTNDDNDTDDNTIDDDDDVAPDATGSNRLSGQNNAAVIQECTARMLAAYISEVQNLPDSNSHGTTDDTMAPAMAVQQQRPSVDKETNTECAFPPGGGKSRGTSNSGGGGVRGFGGLSTHSLLGPIDTIDERVVKRSQTFSPSAAVPKNRYICRLSRSDSDSAMHFGHGGPLGAAAGIAAGGSSVFGAAAGVTTTAAAVAGMQHVFQRGAAERRSLRFPGGASKLMKISGPSSVSSSSSASGAHNKMLPVIPRTSLDLELDLQAQHSKLETLNDEIRKLKDLKQR